MISIIICSRNRNVSEELRKNIAETIGVEYELIVIDNSENKYSIFSAYNEGVKRSKYPYLSFMHEDILFHTDDWGPKVVSQFQDKSVGLVGVVGGHYAPAFPVAWWAADLNSGQCLQGMFENGTYVHYLDKRSDFLYNKVNIEVVSVDGFWFCIPNSMFSKITFDEKTFTGFHCYDIDICFQIRNANYKVIVTSEVLIEHKSIGNIDEQWRKSLIKFYFKWQNVLPAIAGIHLTPEELQEADNRISDFFCSEIESFYLQQKQLQNTLNSKAYRLGKFLLKPFSILKRLSEKR